MVSSDRRSFSRSAWLIQVMPSLMACSIPAAASSSRLRVPWSSEKPSSSCSSTRWPKASLSSPSFWRTRLASSSLSAPGVVAIFSKLAQVRRWLDSKLRISSTDGIATKSVAANCMDTSAILNSRLASESTEAASTPSNAFVTSFCPVVNDTPLTRKPMTGMSAIPMMRVRTETDAIAFARDWIMVVLPMTGVLCGLDVFEELPDLGVEAFGFGREGIGEILDAGSGGAGIGGGAGDTAHRRGAAARLGGGAVDALGDLRHRAVLLLDGDRDRGGNRGDLVDDGVDLLDRLGGVGDGGLDVADLTGDLFGGLGGLPGQRLHLGGNHRKAAPGLAGARRLDGGVEREQVGLSGNRLDQAHHLADAGGGVAELGHGADGAARLADRARGHFRGAVRLAGNLADRGGQLLDRGGGGGDVAGGETDPALGGAGFGGDGIGGAVELVGGALQPLSGVAHARQRLVDRRLEAGDGGGDHLAAVLAFAVGGGLALRQPLAFEHGVAEHDDGARHGAELVLGPGGGDVRGGVAGGEPRHRLRQAVERPRDAAPDQPAERQTNQNRPATNKDDGPARVRLRAGKRRSRRGGALLRGREDRMRLRDQLLAGVGDLLERALDVLIVPVPLRQRRRVVLYAPRKLLLQFGLRRKAAQDRFELAELLEEQFPGRARLVESILRFLAPHGEQRPQEFLAIGLADPGHAFIDGLLDPGGGLVEPLAGALVLGEAELFLLLDEMAEGELELAELLAHPLGIVLVERAGRGGDLLEVGPGQKVVGLETADQLDGRHRDKVGGGELHGHERDLELAACIGKYGSSLDPVERVRYVLLSGRE